MTPIGLSRSFLIALERQSTIAFLLKRTSDLPIRKSSKESTQWCIFLFAIDHTHTGTANTIHRLSKEIQTRRFSERIAGGKKNKAIDFCVLVWVSV